MLNQVALVSQTEKITLSALTTVSAAISKQVTRDAAPVWNLNASVDAFATLEDVPLGYWHVIIMDKIPFQAGGIHLNEDNGQPYALVEYSDDWSLTTSHETIEMLVDPSGNRTVAANSPKPGQGRVLMLVEACDPSEAAQFGYTVNGVLVSDFYTPRFFDPVKSTGVRYSFTGALTAPRQVLDGGYMSWWDPQSKHIFQEFVTGTKKKFVDRGALPEGFGTLRSFTDMETNRHRAGLKTTRPIGILTTRAFAGPKAKATLLDESMNAQAESVRNQIASLIKAYS